MYKVTLWAYKNAWNHCTRQKAFCAPNRTLLSGESCVLSTPSRSRNHEPPGNLGRAPACDAGAPTCAPLVPCSPSKPGWPGPPRLPFGTREEESAWLTAASALRPTLSAGRGPQGNTALPGRMTGAVTPGGDTAHWQPPLQVKAVSHPPHWSSGGLCEMRGFRPTPVQARGPAEGHIRDTP